MWHRNRLTAASRKFAVTIFIISSRHQITSLLIYKNKDMMSKVRSTRESYKKLICFSPKKKGAGCLQHVLWYRWEDNIKMVLNNWV
jgi:hypothetical protein